MRLVGLVLLTMTVGCAGPTTESLEVRYSVQPHNSYIVLHGDPTSAVSFEGGRAALGFDGIVVSLDSRSGRGIISDQHAVMHAGTWSARIKAGRLTVAKDQDFQTVIFARDLLPGHYSFDGSRVTKIPHVTID